MNEIRPSKTGIYDKAPLAVCLSVTSDLAFAASVVIKNFVDLHGRDGIQFFIFSDGPIFREINALVRIGIEASSIIYKPPLTWNAIWSCRPVAYFSPLVLAKFEAFNFLRDFHRVIWLDYDIVIQHPLSALISDKFDIAYHDMYESVAQNFSSLPKELDPQVRGMSAGLLAVTDSFPGHESATNTLYKLFLRFRNVLYMPEQAIFDIYFQTLQLDKRLLSESYCTLPSKATEKSIILHSAGPNKFWNCIENATWQENFETLKAEGLPAFKRSRSSKAKFFRKTRYVLAVSLQAIFSAGARRAIGK
jgi:lipopolysaccharide biosynthesis glycosyltransferase